MIRCRNTRLHHLVVTLGALVGCDAPQRESAPRPIAAAPPSEPSKPSPPARTPDEATEPSAPSVTLCKSLLEDAVFLDQVFADVRSPSFKPGKKTCKQIIERLASRFPEDWKAMRGIPDFGAKGEPKPLDAGRTLYMTCVSIVEQFACEGPAALTKAYGETIVADYERDYRTFVQEVRDACG